MGKSYKLKAERIAQGLLDQLDYEAFHKTGSLTQFFSLRSARARAAFSWCSTCTSEKRFFTSRAVKEGIKMLMAKESLQFPKCPGVSFSSWLEKETEKILGLCQRARRSTSTPAMDNDETQPWTIEEAHSLNIYV